MKMREIAKFQCRECWTQFHIEENYPKKECPKCHSHNTEKIGKLETWK